MLKKLGVIFSLIIILTGIAIFNAQPIFGKLSNNYQVYLEDASSLALIKRVTAREFYSLRGVKGESVELSLDSFDLENILKQFGAEIKFTEQTADSQIYYAYSPNIKYLKKVKGEKINLHIVIAQDRAVLGSPLIFGSF